MEVAVMEAEVMAEAVMVDTGVVDTEAAVMEEDVVEDMVGVVTEDMEEDVMGDMVAVDINSLKPLKTYSTVLFEIFPAFTNNWKSLIWSDSTSALHFVFRRTELYFCRIFAEFLDRIFCLKFVVMKLSLTLSMVCGFS